MKKRLLEASDDADIDGLKRTLAEAMQNIMLLRKSNDELEQENRDITDKISKIRAKIGGGLELDGSIQASSKIKGAEELNRLKARNAELLQRLQALKEVSQGSTDQNQSVVGPSRPVRIEIMNKSPRK